jgi:subtilisin family serine protease
MNRAETIEVRISCLVVLALIGVLAAGNAVAETPAEKLRSVFAELCGEPIERLEKYAEAVGLKVLEFDELEPRPDFFRHDIRLQSDEKNEIRLVRFEQAGQLRYFSAEYYSRSSGSDGDLEPVMLAVAGSACTIVNGRSIIRDATDGEGADSTRLDILADDLETIIASETLEAPWPNGTDSGGVRVAHVDSGIAYDLPFFKDRIARNASGNAIGFDFWDLDPLPYDAETSRSPFLPIRHGSMVASVLLREAPDASLIAYRYPRPDMTRMGELIEHAVNAGARIIMLPLGGNDASEWGAFAKAMREHPDLLAIASAGNNGRDVDRVPVWPAALDLENMLIVTSATPDGALAEGSNWGRTNVDLMIPAEFVPVLDFQGNRRLASGSSYAVPRVAALAAKLLDANPGLGAAELKQAIIARAAHNAASRQTTVYGLLLDTTVE